MYNRNRRGGLGVLLLAGQIMNVGVHRIPPVTLALIAAQTAIFLNFVPQYFPSATAVCMSTYLVYYHKQWKRLILGTFFHADDMHLYFNMSSLLMKGLTLEKRFGSVYFAYLVAVFTGLTSLTYVGLNMFLENAMEDHTYSTSCAVGFSGVLFALKVLTTHYTPPGLHYALGFIPVPSRFIYWAELVLIQMVTPNASFTGHLAGIVVGLLYIKGPLKTIMDGFVPPGPSYTYTARSSGYRSAGYTTGRSWSSPQRQYGQPSYPDHSAYTGGMSEEEQYARAREESLRPQHTTGQSNRLYPDLDELRSRRSEHYNQYR
ncbi:rhomboid-related protein 4-like isoform X1 [Haliotis asinina]|uniref:rhomboid-related protein 4-like isoform X1 n=1 Tax=Haliotis asinina TaxID=109174 RepID=UPI0035322320